MTLERVQAALTLLTLAAVVWLAMRQGQLEARLAVLERPVASAAVAASSERAPAVAASRAAMQAMRAAPSTAAPSGSQVAEEVDEVLWSEDGRAAIGDVVEEQKEMERERQRQRWEKVRRHRTERMLDEVAEEVGLDETQVSELMSIIDTYNDERTAIWQAMEAEEDVDLAALEDRSEQAGDDAEAAIIEVGGEATLEALQSRWGGRGR